jgi:Pyridoxamine 5'-phosphate oxidase
MASVSSSIDEATRNFIQEQHVFFVASAPVDPAGHVNLSPKGLDTFRILAPTQVAYLDLTGSGTETAAHVRENGRIVLMFCAFDQRPRIVRIHGRGRVVEHTALEFAALRDQFPPLEGARAIIVVEDLRVGESCGFGVPVLKYAEDRTQLPAWTHKKGPEGMKQYRAEKNRTSFDGLPGISG